MRNRVRAVAIVLSCAALGGASSGMGVARPGPPSAPAGQWRTLAGEPRDGATTEAFLRRIMSQYDVTALSVAVLDADQVVFERTFGVVDPATGKRADAHTVFRAASLTKPVFAYLVMKLVDEGLLDLDAPLQKYLKKPLHEYPAYASLRDDRRYERLTARLLLSHQGGLPNWRSVRPDGPIQFRSTPGDRFAYSGEGYSLLQFVVEEITGEDLHVLARDRVFAPLGMGDSSFVWETRFDGRFAVELDSGIGRLIEQTRFKGNAAASVITHASDYARFLAAVLNGDGLRPATRAAMLKGEVALTSKSLFSAPGTDGGANRANKMAWTPGWGTFEDAHGPALFHVGAEEGCENYTEAFLDRRLGIVILSLTTSPRSFSAALVGYVIGQAFSPLSWLEYGDRPVREREAYLLRVVLAGLVILALLLLIRMARLFARHAGS
jgi:CubicO group peptidase (beta-lactamase class C family)